MKFKKFQEYLNERQDINRGALDYDKKLAQFNARFDDPKQGAEIVKKAGYKSVGHFISDPNEKKWSKLRIPGQENYV